MPAMGDCVSMDAAQIHHVLHHGLWKCKLSLERSLYVFSLFVLWFWVMWPLPAQFKRLPQALHGAVSSLPRGSPAALTREVRLQDMTILCRY